MKVRIIRNNPEYIETADISEFVGQEFYGKQEQGSNNAIVNFGFPRGTMTVYEGEYEIIDLKTELVDMIRQSNVNLFNVEIDEIINFVMGNREELIGLLK